jgi:inorganic pyrophosphatase
VPTDAVKYELDKASGHLKVDRPQRFLLDVSNALWLHSQTFCGAEVAAICAERSGLDGIEGDGDPMDICVLSEKTFAHGSFF